MSKFLHDAGNETKADPDRTMAIPRHFLPKTAELKSIKCSLLVSVWHIASCVLSSSGPEGHSDLMSYQCVRRAACVDRQHLKTNIQTSSSIKLLDLQFLNFK